jgi:putative flippase GtrA
MRGMPHDERQCGRDEFSPTDLLSIASNMLLTLLSMQWIGLPLLLANTAAVIMMVLLNFALAESRVFRRRLALPGE